MARPPHADDQRFPPQLHELERHGVIRLDVLERLHEEGAIPTDVFDRVRKTGQVSREDFERFGGYTVLEQIVDAGALERLRDEGVVSMEGSVRSALKSGQPNALARSAAWSFLFGSWFILIDIE